MYELVYWRFGTKLVDQCESKDSAIADWVAGFDYNHFFSPGFVDRAEKVAYLPDIGSADDSRRRRPGVWLLEEGLGISLEHFRVEVFEIPPP